MSVLEADELGRRQRQVDRPFDRGFHLIGVKDAVMPFDRARNGSCQNGQAAAFGIENMRGFFNDDFAASGAVADDGRQIGHGPGRQEQGIVLACQFDCDFLQLLDGRIVAPGRIPSWAFAIALIISGVGSVTVSLRKSHKNMGFQPLTLF